MHVYASNWIISMELFWVHIGILCVSIFLIFSFFRQKLLSSGSNHNNLPPGRTGWPIIGETLELFMAGKRGTPEKFVTERMEKHSPDVFKTSLIGQNMAVFCGAEGNKFLFGTANKNLTIWLPECLEKLNWVLEDGRIDMAKMLRSTRRFLLEYLNPNALRSYIQVMDSSAKAHVAENWIPYEEVKISPLAKKYTFELACKLILNMDHQKDSDRIKRIQDPFAMIAAALISLPVNLPGTAYSKAVKAAKQIRTELLEIIEERKMELKDQKKGTNKNGVDMLTRMIQQQQTHAIVSKIVALLLASYDTTSTAITFTFYYLAQHPQVYENVLREQMEIAKSKKPGELLNWDDLRKMKYAWCVICEAMRLAPPCPGSFREAAVDFTYAGFTIPKGWKTSWMTNSTNKNPKYFPNPEKFDPLRFEGNGPVSFSFVPFGGGPHMCPGREYARLAMLAFIYNVMITKIKFKKVNPHDKIVYRPNPNPLDGLLVQLISTDK